MKTLTLVDFIATLPGLVEKANQVVVATYNTVSGHDEGARTMTNGKPLTVLCGGGTYRHVELFPGIAMSVPGADESVRAGASKIVNVMDESPTHKLVVLYAGLTQFDRMWSLTQRLVENGNTVAVIGCGCPDNSHEILHLRELENVVAVTPMAPRLQGFRGCTGGRLELGEIVDSLVGIPAEVV